MFNMHFIACFHHLGITIILNILVKIVTAYKFSCQSYIHAHTLIDYCNAVNQANWIKGEGIQCMYDKH